MHKKMWFGLSMLLILVVVASYVYIMNQQNFSLVQESNALETIELWATSSAVIGLAKQYDLENNNIQVKTRFFHSQDLLLEELYGAVSAGTPPNIAEVHSHYGLFPLVEANSIINLADTLSPALLEDLLPGVASRYQLDGSLWAWPLGTSLPVIYYNQTLLKHYGMDQAIDATTWQSLLQFSSQLLEQQQERHHETHWIIHSDRLTPWYLLTMLKQGTALHSIENEALNEAAFTQWDRMVNDSRLMPALTHQLAITQFVSGQGVFLLSSTDQISLIKRLSAGKFEMNYLPIPRMEHDGPSGYVAGGSGLVVFPSNTGDSGQSLQFIEYIAEIEQAVQVSLQTDYIAAQLSVLESGKIDYKDENFQAIVEEVFDIEPLPLSRDDLTRWHRLLDMQEATEGKYARE